MLWYWGILSQYQSRQQDRLVQCVRNGNREQKTALLLLHHLHEAGGSTGHDSTFRAQRCIADDSAHDPAGNLTICGPYSGCWQREDSEEVIWMPVIPVPAKRQRYCRRYHHQPLQHPGSHDYQWRNHSGSGFCIWHGSD